MGGYGAVFWLWMAALLGMVIKYSEVLLAVKYRERDARGDWVGGPMYYIKNGMGDKWKWLAGAFSVLAALAAFGIGNMSQANSIVGSVTDAVCAVNPDFGGQAALRWGLGIGLALLTALVLFGGIKRIGAVTEKLIPFMSVAYILMTLIVIFGNLGGVGRAFKEIFSAAFAPRAILGGAAGITIRQAVVWGLRRSAFSNEAGLGSAPIAHAAAHCDGPVEQGIYGIFEVFMDTIVICTLTALTIIISGVDVTFGVKPGSALITAAFGTVFNGTSPRCSSPWRSRSLRIQRSSAGRFTVALRAVPAGSPRREGLSVRFHYHDRRRQRLLARFCLEHRRHAQRAHGDPELHRALRAQPRDIQDHQGIFPRRRSRERQTRIKKQHPASIGDGMFCIRRGKPFRQKLRFCHLLC